jgi:hypothetical protein
MVQDKAQGLVLKLDYEKAFDKVSLDFLLDLLAKRGFIVKTISWIKTDYFFLTSKGLRQGPSVSLTLQSYY